MAIQNRIPEARTENREPGTESRRVLSSRFSVLCRVLGSLFLVLLTGCLLVSGEQTSVDLQPGSGNLTASFVSAEGQEVRSLKIAEDARTIQVIVIVEVESGDLRIDLLRPDGAVEFAVEGRADSPVTRTSEIQTDDQGYIHYRLLAQGARGGSYQLLFQE